MKTNLINQEILLFTGTSFAQGEFCNPDRDNNSNRQWPAADKLEKACWDGMLPEILPGVAQKANTGYDSFIWRINTEVNYLSIYMGTSQAPLESEYSVDPYYFMSIQNYN